MIAKNADQTYQEAVAARNAAARKLYEAELAVHDAHQSHVDQWIRATHDRLHTAVVRYVAAQDAVSALRSVTAAPSVTTAA
jgi:hypothetical protein